MTASTLRKLGFALALGVAGIYVYATLRGPNGVAALMEKRKEIRALQEQNANLAQEIRYRQERNRRLREDRAAQEEEIRRRLNLQRKNETSFKLQDAPPPEGQPQPK